MIVISPAKKLDFNPYNIDLETTSPYFLNKTKILVSKLKELQPSNIKTLMGLSDKLTDLNYKRYQEFSTINQTENQKPAIYAFSGDTYLGLSSQKFSQIELNYAQNHLRILSGLYGLLRPLDLIQPYRLEMGTKTNQLIEQSLYSFWTNEITDKINDGLRETKSKFLYNLSSNEYFKSININKINIEIFTPVFYIKKNGELKPSGMFSKKCRGAMAKMIIKNKINDLKSLEKFSEYGYKFDSKDSNKNTFIFIKNK